jgi:anion transporter
LSASSLQTSASAPAPARRARRLPFAPLAGAVLFAVAYAVPVLQAHPTVHSTLAILILVAFLWASEGFPVYATAYVVPLLAVWLGVGLGADGARLAAAARATAFAHPFMDPMIFVYLGCMAMSAALCKLSIADRLSGRVFRRLPTRPRALLLALMLLNLGVSSVLSTTASTALVLTLALPVVRALDPDDPFAKALLFGICWSGNCGGMATWIAAPQNLMALNTVAASGQDLPLAAWLALGVPLALAVCLVGWAYLCLRFPPRRAAVPLPQQAVDFPAWALKHTLTCVVTGATILLWVLHPLFANVLGDIGITSLVPVIAFFGSKLLVVDDFHAIRWPTLALMGGGLAIREAMTTSNFLNVLQEACQPAFARIPTYPLLLIVLIIVYLFASCMNSTVAAAILYPLVAIVGAAKGQSRAFVCLSAMTVNSAQLFHMSTFANSLIYGVLKHIPGNRQLIGPEKFLNKIDFPYYTWPTSITSILLISSLGYGIIIGLDRII